MTTSTHCVYHLHANTGTDYGYVGATKALRNRLYEHRSNGLLKEDVYLDILKIGTEQECLALEAALRPEPGMGWNIAEGGWNKCIGTIGEATRIQPGDRFSIPTEFQRGQQAHNAGATAYLLTDPAGNKHTVQNLTTFCAANNLTRENIRKVARGNRKHHKQWTAVFA